MTGAKAQPATPAGFWHRYAAWSLDWLLLGSVLGVLVMPLLQRAWAQALALNQLLQDWVYQRVIDDNGAPSPVAMSGELLSDPALKAAAEQGSAALSGTITSIALLLFGLSALYFVLTEAGPWQGTPGKRLLKLRVRAADGGDVGFARALLRHVGGVVSWLLFNLGHAIAGWRSDKRALHDLIAGTRVDAQAPIPGWGRAWLALQLVLFAAIFAGSVGWMLRELYQISQI